jgi:hypothetical protein
VLPRVTAAPARRRRRGKVLWILLALVLVAGLGAGAWRVRDRFTGPQAAPPSTPSATATPTPTPTPTPSPTPPPLAPLRFRAAPITLTTQGWMAWSLMDRRTGEIWGSDTMTQTTWPASMIKPWLASDYLRRFTERGQTPTTAQLHEVEIMIRDSDNDAAIDLFAKNGGDASIKRLITTCHLTDTTTGKGWSQINISARDGVRMADCIADGTAAGPQWTDWLLDMMRKVRGEGDFGIRKALPNTEAAQVSIKNGWLRYTDDSKWHINCMAVTDTYALVILQRYTGTGQWNTDDQYGRDMCRQIATQLLNPAYVMP